MRTWPSYSLQILRALAAVALICVAAMVVGANSSSTNYRMEFQSRPQAAGMNYSTNFKVASIVPESPAGPVCVSTNFRIETFIVADTYDPIDTTPPVITAGPTVLYTSDTRALIEWSTDELADGDTQYGLTTGYGSLTTQLGGYSTLHQVLITGLTASTLYNFRVRSTDPYNNGPTVSANAQFTTNAMPDVAGPIVTPSVTFLSITSARVDFTTNEAATSLFHHGPTAALGTDLADPVFRISHSRTLTGLTAGATHFYAIDATDPSGNATAGATQSFVLPNAVAITTTSLPNATQGQVYSQTIAAAGGVGALSYSIVSGTLPSGISLNGSTGALTGTPAATGSFSFSIRAIDSGIPASQATQALMLTVTSSSAGGGGKKGGGDDGGCSTGETQDAWMLLATLAAFAAVYARKQRRQSRNA